MSDSCTTSASARAPAKQELRYLASVCSICGAAFPPRVDHFHFLSQKWVSNRLRKHRRRAGGSSEVCPFCVESVLGHPKPFRVPFFSW